MSSKSLTQLFKKNAFVWDKKVEATFNILKVAMISALILIMSDFNQPFTLETDASEMGIGVVLIHERKHITYFNKALGQRSLSTYEKELMIFVAAIQK
jgi:RNase H-like domain found in reverse transcriptase